MDIGHYRKFIERILHSEHPEIALTNLGYLLMDEEFAKEAIYRVLFDIFRQNLTVLKQKGIKIETIREIVDRLEKFREYKDMLCEALLLADGGVTLEAEVERLSKQELTKLEIYNLFLELFSYVQYRKELYHDFEDQHSDLIADSILDRLWGGGWDKGKRLLPNEPDICDLMKPPDSDD
ncbi:MAG TPA: hypothetical protein VMV49_17405 [Candidatus Deferrimicrobium sp.]|nr:hypothetical protein [Candidatus Deferrimicrobium sp.]